MSTPGHTPGHQVPFVRLAERGSCSPEICNHYPEERTTGRIPTFEFNAEQSRASRQKVEAFVRKVGGGAVDRARHRHARQAAEGAPVRRVGTFAVVERRVFRPAAVWANAVFPQAVSNRTEPRARSSFTA